MNDGKSKKCARKGQRAIVARSDGWRQCRCFLNSNDHRCCRFQRIEQIVQGQKNVFTQQCWTKTRGQFKKCIPVVHDDEALALQAFDQFGDILARDLLVLNRFCKQRHPRRTQAAQRPNRSAKNIPTLVAVFKEPAARLLFGQGEFTRQNTLERFGFEQLGGHACILPRAPTDVYSENGAEAPLFIRPSHHSSLDTLKRSCASTQAATSMSSRTPR